MKTWSRIISALASFLLVGYAMGIRADSPPARISGTIKTFDGTVLTIQSKGGDSVTIAVPAGTRIGALVNRTLADIKPGEFVGSAALKGADGKLHAQEVHIFPEKMRGTGEGHRPMGQPNQSMTNATVAVVAEAASGQTLKLKYKGGEQEIVVAPDARIVGMIDGDLGLLKPGAAVWVMARKNVDGSLTAIFVQAEKDGVKPLF